MQKLTLDELLTLIPKKEDGTITAKKLAEMTDKCESHIRKLINEARASGISVCSTRFGYYLSNERNDIVATIQFLTRRVETQLKAIDGLTQSLMK